MFTSKKRYFLLQKYKDYAIVTTIKETVILVTGYCFLEHKHDPAVTSLVEHDIT
jgi:hypothetical protein